MLHYLMVRRRIWHFILQSFGPLNLSDYEDDDNGNDHHKDRQEDSYRNGCSFAGFFLWDSPIPLGEVQVQADIPIDGVVCCGGSSVILWFILSLELGRVITDGKS